MTLLERQQARLRAKAKKEKTVIVPLRLPIRIDQRISEVAKRSGVSRSGVINVLLVIELMRLEAAGK